MSEREKGLTFLESRKIECETKQKDLLLCDEPLTFEEVKKLAQMERSNKWPENEELAAYLKNMPERAIEDVKVHRVEIEAQGGNAEELIRNF